MGALERCLGKGLGSVPGSEACEGCMGVVHLRGAFEVCVWEGCKWVKGGQVIDQHNVMAQFS